jgi:hypothetical protein
MRNLFTESLERLLTNKSKATLVALSESPIAAQAWADAEAKAVAGRAALIKELQELPAANAKEASEVSKAHAAATVAVKKASEDLEAASRELEQATIRMCSLSNSARVRDGRIRMELEAGADPRINSFIRDCQQLQNDANNLPLDLVTVRERRGEDFFAKDRLVLDNTALVAIIRALATAIERAQPLKLKALTTDEVTRELCAIADAMRPSLGALASRTPTIDADPMPAAMH